MQGGKVSKLVGLCIFPPILFPVKASGADSFLWVQLLYVEESMKHN